MSFDNQTNAGRVNKVMDLLLLIQKSAESNSASTEELWAMLERPINLMGEMLGEEPERPEPQAQAPERASKSTKTPMWASIKEMAETVPVKDLLPVLLIIHSRVDEEMEPRP